MGPGLALKLDLSAAVREANGRGRKSARAWGWVLYAFAAAMARGTPLEAPQVEEGTAFARGAAAAALSGDSPSFGEALDADRMLAAHLGGKAWKGLTQRQQAELRGHVRDRFLAALAAPRGSESGIEWISARPDENQIFVDAGLRLGDRTLKTRWTVARRLGIWKVDDVRLSDPGISLADEAVRSIAAQPVRSRERVRQARAQLLPRLLGLSAIAIVVLATRRRLSPARRPLLYWTAAAPAILFLVDGVLAARRAYSETYALVRRVPQPWKAAEEQAERAVRLKDPARALEEWERALRLGASPAPILFRMGLLARERGAVQEARALFERAIAEPTAAPGAARELAAYRLEERRDAEARALLMRYVAAAGPDPETLWLVAVAESNLGNHAAGVEAIRAARAMTGEGARGAELEARVRARAGDARGTVEALRRAQPDARLDRFALRADPAYLPIATDPVWVAFLAETPVPVTPLDVRSEK